jgi:hypothetical protein
MQGMGLCPMDCTVCKRCMRDGGASIGDNGTLDDLNGNTVGRYRIVEC